MMSKISTLEHWAFGITVVIGGQFFSWNLALAAGFGAFLLDFFLVAFGYFSLCCCLGEMSSTLQAPFAGALFCFTRAAFGRIFGFFLAALEVLEYIGYVASTLIVFGGQLTYVFGTDQRLEPVWWLLVFFISCPVYIKGLSWFWKINVMIAIVMIAQLVIYFILAVSISSSSLSYTKMQPQDQESHGFNKAGGFNVFASSLPEVLWLFVGVEGLTLVNEQLKNHQFTHKGMLYCCLTLMCTALLVIFGVVTNPPGISELSTAAYPLNYVLQTYGASSRGATWFSIIPTFATAFGFIFLYTTLINSLARSAVIPEWIGNPPSESPIRSMVVGSVLVYLITLIGWLSTDASTLTATLFSVYQIAAVTVYMVQIAAFVVMRTEFANLGRTWNSPLGIPGAVAGLVIFALVLLCLIIQQSYTYKWLLIAIWFVPVSLYYYFWGQYAKPASEEEIRAMFRMHTMRTNRTRKHTHTYRKCEECHKFFCNSCRKKSHHGFKQNIFTHKYLQMTMTENFVCWTCQRSTELRSSHPRGSASNDNRAREFSTSTSGTVNSTSYDNDLDDEEIETILMARSLDKKCVVAGCICRNLKFKPHEKTCECGHLAIYHESTEEALGLSEIGGWKRLTDVSVLEEILIHTEKAKLNCIASFDHKIEGIRHRISHLKHKVVHEAKLAEIRLVNEKHKQADLIEMIDLKKEGVDNNSDDNNDVKVPISSETKEASGSDDHVDESPRSDTHSVRGSDMHLKRVEERSSSESRSAYQRVGGASVIESGKHESGEHVIGHVFASEIGSKDGYEEHAPSL